MSVDTVGNFLTVIRNGIAASKSQVTVPYSKLKGRIAEILKEEGFIRDYTIEVADSNSNKGHHKHLTVWLKYVDGESVIHEITRLSTPGRRIYRGIKNVSQVIGGLGLVILTTSRGIMTDKQARVLNVGGELLCELW